MLRRLLPLLVALILALSAGPALAQGDDGDDRSGPDRGEDPRDERADGRGDQRDERADGAGDDADDDAGDDRSGPDRGPRERPIRAGGSFQIQPETSQVRGDYASFSYTDATLDAFTVGNTTLFDVVVTGETDDDDRRASARGAQVRIETPTFALHAHDNPLAATQLRTDGTITLTLRAGAQVVATGDEGATFRIGDVTGRLRGDDLAIAGLTVTAEDRLVFAVDAKRGAFDVHRERLGEAVANGRIGAEASIQRGPDGDVEEDVVQFGNVTLTTLRAEKGNLTLLIDGHGFDGRVLVLNVDGRVLGAQHEGELELFFDNASMAQASSLADVLDPDDDGLDAEYYIVFDPQTETFQLIVSVPHYSVHTLSVMTSIVQAPPSVVAGVLGGILLLAASGFVLFRRPK